MDSSSKNKIKIILTIFTLMLIPGLLFYFSIVTINDYINKENIVKIYPGLFFVFFAPLIIYISFGLFMMLINKGELLSKNKVFNKILNVLVCFSIFSFIFVVIGPMYIDDDLISKGYIRCQVSSFKSPGIYVIDSSLCKK